MLSRSALSSSFFLVVACVGLVARSANAVPIIVPIDNFNGVDDGGDFSTSLSVGAPGGGSFSSGLGSLLYAGGNEVLLVWDGSLDADFTSGGTSAGDVLQIVVGTFIANSPVTAEVTLFDGQDLVGDQRSTPISATGTVDLSFNGTAEDLSDIQTIRLRIFGDPADFALTLTRVQAVPEPTTAMLLGAGLIGLTLAGRRRAA